MKKFVSILVSLALVLSFASIGLFATEPGDNRNVEITTSIAPSYTVVIPANTIVTYGQTSTTFGTVKLTAVNMEPGGFVSVSVIKGDLANDHSSTYKIPYTIQNTSGTEVSSISLFDTEDKADLNICITSDDWAAAKAGSYSATVSFEISIGEVS
jgi:hypothetical protein